MTKSILISIRPEWVAKILNGEKTIEIRKTIPKCNLLVDVYIYCTKEKPYLNDYRKFEFCNEFVLMNKYADSLNGKVVAKFTLNCIETIFNDGGLSYFMNGTPHLNDKACLTDREINKYLNGKTGYSWYINDLVIFNKPKELSDFKKVGFSSELNDFIDRYKWNVKNMPLDMAEDEQNSYEENCNIIKERYEISKSPKSWCYVEVEND